MSPSGDNRAIQLHTLSCIISAFFLFFFSLSSALGLLSSALCYSLLSLIFIYCLLFTADSSILLIWDSITMAKKNQTAKTVPPWPIDFDPKFASMHNSEH
jgi:hypothetical protein